MINSALIVLRIAEPRDALVAIKDKKPICALRASYCMKI
jgi:hypothetical protein